MSAGLSLPGPAAVLANEIKTSPRPRTPFERVTNALRMTESPLFLLFPPRRIAAYAQHGPLCPTSAFGGKRTFLNGLGLPLLAGPGPLKVRLVRAARIRFRRSRVCADRFHPLPQAQSVQLVQRQA